MENISESFWGKSLAQHCLENEQKVNMKYKLKRDLPWAKAGEEFEISTWRGFQILIGAKIQQPFMLTQEMVSDWFEEADERWEPKPNEIYFFIDLTDKKDEEDIVCKAHCGYDIYDDARYKSGNCFRTRELAEQAAEQIKALLKEFHKKNP